MVVNCRSIPYAHRGRPARAGRVDGGASGAAELSLARSRSRLPIHGCRWATMGETDARVPRRPP
ncbi:hypothetical protein SAMCFNEI73_pC1899 (plasmid) [Sinorhizobium americanum]|uniref:Uncharacterized protein n=1 Tax=Sinorhizobium americanum TaxID=194963 RepID=A0A1L3LZR3_9HYPH|nr:hypothetical protein SAMCFNEI73_pC1899 [Sinorhizobium americanum]